MKSPSSKSAASSTSAPAHSLSTSPARTARGEDRRESRSTVATSKNYADSRLRQFCLR